MSSSCTGIESMVRAHDLYTLSLLVLVLFAMTAALPAAAESRGLRATLLSPGPLSLAHAEEENHCDSCHDRSREQGQTLACLECHDEVAADRRAGGGFHGRVREAPCKTCHTEHRGREFDILGLDQDGFDHAQTDFPLQGRHAAANCTACHEAGAAYRSAPQACNDCHGDDNPHDASLGSECESCHVPRDWQQTGGFNHDDTGFALTGGHADLACASCHVGQRYSLDATQCIACHRVNDVHRGVMGKACDDCHGTDDWRAALFDHDTDTDFRLLGAHRDLACQACHHTAPGEGSTSGRCVACHAGADIHAGRHGESCGDCHDSRSWQKTVFDHRQETGWALPAGHETLECAQCHPGKLSDPVDETCGGCHEADDVHHSSSMTRCEACHDPHEWTGAPGFDHELTGFPLEGMHAVAPCQGCHVGHDFSSAAAQCVDCHEAEDAHHGVFGRECQACHSPNDWALWWFDHGAQTDFELTGLHAKLACADCHTHAGKTPSPVCGECHAADDRHGGQFGVHCDRCHRGDDFKEAQWPD